MSFYRISHALLFISIVSMLLGPVSEAKARAGLTNQIGLKNTATLQNKGLSGLNDLNTQSLLTQSSSKKSASKQVSIQKSDEELLSKLSQDIYWKLKDWQGSKSNTLLAQDEKQELSNWISQLDSLQTKVNKNMNKLTQWIKEKKLSAIIMQRQQDAISKINSEIEGLKRQLSQLNQAATLSSSKQQLKGSFDFFKGKQLKRKHQVFDGLSSVALTPDRIAPAKNTQEFAKYKFTKKTDKSNNKAADFDNAIYLGTSDEVVINQYIQDKATELENDPVKIYHWVRNNIEWLPSHGAIQASDITLGSGRGNAFDQSSLLIALLRAANIPARYAYGTVEIEIDKFTNWVGLTNPEAAITFVQYGAIPVAPIIEGGVITKVQMEHIWVEAAIDFNPSRGAKNITPDSWISLDASFKQYEVLTGLDPIAISGVNTDQVIQEVNNSFIVDNGQFKFQGFDLSTLKNSSLQISESMDQHINNNFTSPTIGDVFGGRRTIIKDFPVLPASGEIKVLHYADNFTELLESMRPKYRLAFKKDILGDIQEPLELNFSRLNNRKLTLSFKPATQEDNNALLALVQGAQSIEEVTKNIPAHLIQVIPQISLDEQIIKTGTPSYLGYDVDLFFQLEFTTGQKFNNSYMIPAGSFVNLMFNPGSVSGKTLIDLKSKMESTNQSIVNSDLNSLSREKIMGDLYYLSSLTYGLEETYLTNAIAKILNVRFNSSPIYGTSGFEPNVNYLFGLPINIHSGSSAFNLYTTRQFSSENHQNNLIFNQMAGALTSFLEHSVLEQVNYDGASSASAVSSVKLLSEALFDEQSLYILNSDTIANLDSQINIDRESEQEIKQAVDSGYIVIVHENNIELDGWNGAGYIIANPITGDASFKITGGRNGGDQAEPYEGNGVLIALSESADMIKDFFIFILDVLAFVNEIFMLERLLHIYNVVSNLYTVYASCMTEGDAHPIVTAFAWVFYTFMYIAYVILTFILVATQAFLPIIGFIFFTLMSALLSKFMSIVAEACESSDNPNRSSDQIYFKNNWFVRNYEEKYKGLI